MTLGSSPLTRGKLRRNRVDRIGLRLIPAHAGKTGSSHVFSPRRSGSSPLTRGKRPLERNTEMHTRLIPAHAGKTAIPRIGHLVDQAHPRSRGENFLPVTSAHSRPGSSPLTRGKHEPGGQRLTTHRLIPAHAGKTRDHPSRSCRGWAHPRSRGENIARAIALSAPCGSSPLTRGKRDLQVARVGNRRLIPAHAGKTDLLHIRKRELRAHPRSRGENAGPWAPAVNMTGSSPLTRGKPRRTSYALAVIRLIPAHAGKTR